MEAMRLTSFLRDISVSGASILTETAAILPPGSLRITSISTPLPQGCSRAFTHHDKRLYYVQTRNAMTSSRLINQPYPWHCLCHSRFFFPLFYPLGFLFGFLLSLTALLLMTITASTCRQDKRLNNCICATGKRLTSPRSSFWQPPCWRSSSLRWASPPSRLSHRPFVTLHALIVYFLPACTASSPALIEAGCPPLRLRGIASVFKRKTGAPLPGNLSLTYQTPKILRWRSPWIPEGQYSGARTLLHCPPAVPPKARS